MGNSRYSELVGRKITTLKVGRQVVMNGMRCEVTEVYSHIAYLKPIDKKPEESEPFCVCLGDLVIAGIEPSMVSI